MPRAENETMPPKKPPTTGLAIPQIEERIHEVRGHNVMLAHDLAELYGVDVRVLNQAVARNAARSTRCRATARACLSHRC